MAPASHDRPGPAIALAVLGDTQIMTRDRPGDYDTAADWLIRHAPRLGIGAVVHVGDVVNDGAADERQIAAAERAHDRLAAAGLPLFVAAGNHDDDVLMEDPVRRSTMFSTRLSSTRYASHPWFGGSRDDTGTNVFGSIRLAGRRTLVVVCEFGPRPEVVDWVLATAAAHPDHDDVIVVTHAYLDVDGELTRPGTDFHPSDYPATADGLDGVSLWARLRSIPSLRLVVSGHRVPGPVSHRLDHGAHGNPVVASFQNWQTVPGGGAGRLRLVDGMGSGHVRLRVLNPVTGRFEQEPGYHVELATHPARAAGRTGSAPPLGLLQD